MKITLSKSQITEIVSAATSVITRKCSLPVLEHVRFRLAESGQLETTATDLEQTLTLMLTPESAEGTGECLMPLAELRTVKASLKGKAAVTIETAGPDTLRVITRTAAGDLVHPCAAMPADEFPADPEGAELADCDLDAFLTACRAAAASASRDSSRGAITGICLDSKEKAAVGTDGRRLTQRPIPDLPLSTDAVLPVTRALLKLDSGTAGTGRVGLREGAHATVFELHTDTVRYVCKCMPGTYPNYRQVIPGSISSFPYAFTFSDSGLDTIGSLAPHVRHDSSHPLFIAGNGDCAAAGIEAGDGGCAAVLPDCRFAGPQAAAVAVNCDFLQEALRHGFREMRMQDALTPLCFSDRAGGLHLIMPLRGEPSAALASQFEKILGGAVVPVTAQADEPVTESEAMPEAETEPQPVTAQDKEEPEMTEEKKTAETHKPDLKMVETSDPLARLDGLAAESQDALKQAEAAVRELKKQVRTVKAAYREREKEIAAREKEMAKNLTLISRLQEAMAA
jgi:DNA polymerase III sliding clamp (beta) subunit (PCNA family)